MSSSAPEVLETESSKVQTTSLSGKLSQENFFATPTDFLQSLKQDYDRLPQAYPGYLTMPDLDAVAQTNSDPKLRAEAVVAANHFADLQKLSATEHSGSKGYITEDDIASALNLQSDDLDTYKSGLEKMQTAQSLEAAGIESVLTTATLLTCEAPLVAGFFALGALGTSAVEMSNYYFLQNRIDNAKTASDQIRSSMSTWSELNRGK